MHPDDRLVIQALLEYSHARCDAQPGQATRALRLADQIAAENGHLLVDAVR